MEREIDKMVLSMTIKELILEALKEDVEDMTLTLTFPRAKSLRVEVGIHVDWPKEREEE